MTQRTHLPAGRLHETRPYHIPGIEGTRRLTIYLPPGYDHTTEHYPVAYMFDGQNLFGDEGSYSGGWHIHRALDKRAAKGLNVPVVVGIHHGGVARAEELAPWPVAEGQQALGDALLDWIVGPLDQMIRAEFRLLPGPEHTLLGGSSLGGLMALYGFFRHNDVFGKALCMSPSLWVNEGEIFHYVSKAACSGFPRVYLDCGAREAQGIVIEHAKWMADLLERKGFVRNAHFLWRPDARGAHNERNWRRRLPKALHYLYS